MGTFLRHSVVTIIDSHILFFLTAVSFTPTVVDDDDDDDARY